VSRPTVYLGGQITGLTYDEARDWRTDAIAKLDAAGIAGICPMRAQEHLRAHGVLAGSHEDNVTTTSHAIMQRDHYDCLECNIMIANVLGMSRISAGTTMEIAWCYHEHKPVILVMEEDGAHAHPMIDEAITYRVDTMAEAVRLAIALLEVYR
jgi:nucleoside 2-deoxyribosyltransferase